jgi:hypothetical protein
MACGVKVQRVMVQLRRLFYMPPFGSRQKGSPALPGKINL